MQKSRFHILFFIIIILSYFIPVFAQENRVSNLGDVTIRFCNDTTVTGGTKSLVLDTETEKDTEICMYLNNNGPTDVKVRLNFVDGTVTADADQKKACEPEESKENFGKFVTAQDTELFIKAGQTLQTKATIRFPAGYAGTSYGCVTYQILQDTTANAQSNVGMFNIVSRRANFIDVNVAGEIVMNLVVIPETNSSLEILNPGKEISLYYNLVEKKFKARTILQNVGNIGVVLNSHGYYSIFWGLIKKSFPLQDQKILPNQTKTLEFTLPSWLRYVGGMITVGYKTSAEAMIPKQDAKKPKNITLDYEVHHMFTPRGLLIFIIFIGWYIRSNVTYKKKYHK